MHKSIDDGNNTFQWALEFINELAANGLEHIVISPGSRSTPLTLAAAVHPRIKKHVVLDERSAGFLALGIGKATGRPAALICTSGTAAANYYPAVIEAKMSGIPLIVLTADRPPHLRSIGASQAIDQIKMYGDYPLLFFEVGEPQLGSSDVDRLRLLATQAYNMSRDEYGPVHLNFAFRKPLEPTADYLESTIESLKEKIKSGIQPKTLSGSLDHLKTAFPEEITRVISESKHPVIIAGPSAPTQYYRLAVQLSETFSIPLLAESSSQLISHIKPDNLVVGFDSFLRSREICNDLEPDLILRFGDQPVSKGLELYLNHHKEVYHISFTTNAEWQDATLSVNYRINEHPVNFTLENLTIEVSEDWLKKWQDIRDNFFVYRDKILSNTDILTDGIVYHTIGKTLTGPKNIFLSNSFPARDLDLFASPLEEKHSYFVNRGASGIDGLISSAIGATVASNKNGVLFVGDLAFLHDSNALLSGKLLPPDRSLIIVILNNKGGNIFRMLPVYQHKEYFSTYFETPQNVSVKDLAQAHHIGYRRVQYPSNLASSFKELSRQTGVQLLECITDPDQSMNQRHDFWID